MWVLVLLLDKRVLFRIFACSVTHLICQTKKLETAQKQIHYGGGDNMDKEKWNERPILISNTRSRGENGT